MPEPKIDTAWFQGLIKDKGYSQRGFARLIEMDHAALSLMLNGKRKMSVGEAGTLARLLGQPVAEVLRRAGVEVRASEQGTPPTPAPDTGRTAEEMPEALRAELMPDAENLAVALTEAVLADGLGFKGPFEEFGRIAEPLLLDALGAARRDVAQIANNAAEAEAAHLRSRLLQAEQGGVASRLWGKTYDQIAADIRGAKLPGQAEALVARLIEDARALERDFLNLNQEAGDGR